MEKRSLKKLFYLILIATIGYSMSIFISKANEVLPDDSAKMPEVFLGHANALDAYFVLSNSFKVEKDGNVTYPNDYAGSWIEDDKLVIAIVPSENAKTNNSVESNKYKELLSEYDSVIYTTAKYSLNELDTIRHTVFNELKDETTIVSHYVDVAENKISLGFLEYEEASIFHSLDTLISESNILNENLSNNQTMSDLFILRKDELIETE